MLMRLFIFSFIANCTLAFGNNNINLRNVVVVGGTHGNEYTGIWCIKALDRIIDKLNLKYPSLRISTLLANPQAYMENKRFIHCDLNRQFTRESLTRRIDGDGGSQPVELMRALEIDKELGPKFSSADTKTDVIIDLHTTTTNMGATIIVAEGDRVMTRCASYIIKKCAEEDVRCILHTHPNREARPNLSSVAKHGLTIEVGPVPQGVLRHDIVEKTQMIMYSALEYLSLYNTNPAQLDKVLRDHYESSGFKVPCFRSVLSYKKGHMSGKLDWPSIDDNPNFPELMVHKDLQDQDFQKVEKGDPIFVDLEGNSIPYDGSHGTPAYFMFINEAGYYYKSSGTGIAVAARGQFDLESGKLVEEVVTSIDNHCAEQ